MNLEIARKIVDSLQNMGVEAELDEEYSGRFMFGKTTAGIVTGMKNAPMIGFAYALAIANEGDVDSANDELNRTNAVSDLPRNIDNMGRDDMIFY